VSYATSQPEITILYDGDCPLCVREIEMLRRRDRGTGRLGLSDIASADFRASDHGVDHQTLMARIHGVLPGGRLIEGVEVFRRAYAAVGLGWLLAPTGWPLLRPLADATYRGFARNRLRLTGRSNACSEDRCIPPNIQDLEPPRA
jgi:predicted DCC family thiol-disulfide oxidoreductase YuxK